MYAVVEINGKQYRAEKGASLTVDLMAEESGAQVSLDKVVLLAASENDVRVGTPYVAGASVVGTVESEIKDDKVIVFKYKPKKDYRRKAGHRQRYTVLKVEEIVGA